MKIYAVFFVEGKRGGAPPPVLYKNVCEMRQAWSLFHRECLRALRGEPCLEAYLTENGFYTGDTPVYFNEFDKNGNALVRLIKPTAPNE